MAYLQIAAGLVLLLGGGEFLVRGAVSVARRLDISPLVIGVTLVGFGTSAPELLASVEAALKGAPAIAVGNVVGSNIANILLILGVTAAIAPVYCSRKAFMRDGTVLVLVTAVAVAVCLAAVVGRTIGLGLVAALVGYVILSYRLDKASPSGPAEVHAGSADTVEPMRVGIWTGLAISGAGLAAVLLGASFLVDGAIALATAMGISQAVIGLTVVAIGTSLPELATAVVAALRRHTDVAFGNIVGSNIFNILGILGTTAIIVPLEVPSEILSVDLWVMVGATAILVPAVVSGWRIRRSEGALFLACYAAYIGFQTIR